MSSVGRYFSDLWQGMASTLIGMQVTGRNAFTRPVTELYPHAKYQVPKGYRGILDCKMEDCTGCLACARACPVNCIHIKTSRRDPEDFATASDGTAIKLWTTQFDIDMSLCMECGLCTDPCPTECLTMSAQYELAAPNKKALYLEFAVDAERAEAAARRTAERKAAEARAAAKAAAAAGTAGDGAAGAGPQPAAPAGGSEALGAPAMPAAPAPPQPAPEKEAGE